MRSASQMKMTPRRAYDNQVVGTDSQGNGVGSTGGVVEGTSGTLPSASTQGGYNAQTAVQQQQAQQRTFAQRTPAAPMGTAANPSPIAPNVISRSGPMALGSTMNLRPQSETANPLTPPANAPTGILQPAPQPSTGARLAIGAPIQGKVPGLFADPNNPNSRGVLVQTKANGQPIDKYGTALPGRVPNTTPPSTTPGSTTPAPTTPTKTMLNPIPASGHAALGSTTNVLPNPGPEALGASTPAKAVADTQQSPSNPNDATGYGPTFNGIPSLGQAAKEFARPAATAVASRIQNPTALGMINKIAPSILSGSQRQQVDLSTAGASTPAKAVADTQQSPSNPNDATGYGPTFNGIPSLGQAAKEFARPAATAVASRIQNPTALGMINKIAPSILSGSQRQQVDLSTAGAGLGTVNSGAAPTGTLGSTGKSMGFSMAGNSRMNGSAVANPSPMFSSRSNTGTGEDNESKAGRILQPANQAGEGRGSMSGGYGSNSD